MVLNENGRALPIISLSSPTTTTRRSAHPGRGARRWRAFVLIWNEKPPQRTFLLLQKMKVIYLGTSLRCHIYPRKRQRSRQVTADMSETCTGRGGGWVAVSLENRSNPAAAREFEGLRGIFKVKGYFKAALECLSLPEPNSTEIHYVWESSVCC